MWRIERCPRRAAPPCEGTRGSFAGSAPFRAACHDGSNRSSDHGKTRKRNDSSERRSPVSLDSTEENLLTPSEVAALFRVDPKTVTRWAKAGKLTAIRTLGGHRRYRESEVRALLDLPSQRSA
jgi:excisionase family DNA binding protein